MSSDQASGSLDSLRDLHAQIDDQAGAIAATHADILQCRRGCHACCVDELTVFTVEADRIRRDHAELLQHGSPAPLGACAMLDSQGACRIYASRPYVCRTQGLPLRWIDEIEGEWAEFRDICPLNDVPHAPIVEIAPEDCWTIGQTEGALAALQRAHQPEDLYRRVALRALFDAPTASGSSAHDES